MMKHVTTTSTSFKRYSPFMTGFFFLVFLLCAADSQAATGSPSSAELLKAKQESESKGYRFMTSRGDIVAGAKKEGKLRLLSSLGQETFDELRTAFVKQYPFIETHVETLDVDAQQRFFLELRAGRGTEWDFIPMAAEYYLDVVPQLMKIDILSMAKHGVLKIPVSTVDPNNRNIVSIASALFSNAYNKNLLAPHQLPKTWEDFLKPEFKGKKFLEDIRPIGFAALASGFGIEWAVNYARKIKEQDPVWVRGQTRSITGIAIGEQSLLHLSYYHSCMRAKEKDVTKSLECQVLEPVPARIHELTALTAHAQHPNAALLWLEFNVSPIGQAIIDKNEPLKSSLYISGSELEKVIRGKKVAVNNWETLHNTEKWMDMVIEAFGYPKAKSK